MKHLDTAHDGAITAQGATNWAQVVLLSPSPPSSSSSPPIKRLYDGFFCLYHFTSTMGSHMRPGRLPCAPRLAKTLASSTRRVASSSKSDSQAATPPWRSATQRGWTAGHHIYHIPWRSGAAARSLPPPEGTLPAPVIGRRHGSVFPPLLGRERRRRPGAQAHGSTVGREEADETLGSGARRRHLLSGRSQVWPSRLPFPPPPSSSSSPPIRRL